jgi:hypothetical protein
VTDTGLLPIEQPEMVLLGDKNHRVHMYAHYYFKLVQMAAEQSQCHFVDAEAEVCLRLFPAPIFKNVLQAVSKISKGCPRTSLQFPPIFLLQVVPSQEVEKGRQVEEWSEIYKQEDARRTV